MPLGVLWKVTHGIMPMCVSGDQRRQRGRRRGPGPTQGALLAHLCPAAASVDPGQVVRAAFSVSAGTCGML
eukprot:9730-Eustigmatos_ZCMA.PRE.1